MKDLQSCLGLSAPQAIYRWLRGEGLPSVDNLFALSRLLNTSIDDILIEEGGSESLCILAPLSNQLNMQAINYYYLHVQAA